MTKISHISWGGVTTKGGYDKGFYGKYIIIKFNKILLKILSYPFRFSKQIKFVMQIGPHNNH